MSGRITRADKDSPVYSLSYIDTCIGREQRKLLESIRLSESTEVNSFVDTECDAVPQNLPNFEENDSEFSLEHTQSDPENPSLPSSKVDDLYSDQHAPSSSSTSPVTPASSTQLSRKNVQTFSAEKSTPHICLNSPKSSNPTLSNSSGTIDVHQFKPTSNSFRELSPHRNDDNGQSTKKVCRRTTGAACRTVEQLFTQREKHACGDNSDKAKSLIDFSTEFNAGCVRGPARASSHFPYDPVASSSREKCSSQFLTNKDATAFCEAYFSSL
eukprot:m.33305 g.33305  ORF g.33305 m.33305 type:complete len:270 (-) comp14223_c0_seq3:254-1063(-)